MNSMVNGESIILFGPPGAGKGTQSGLISTITGKPQVSTGDMLREAVSDNSEVGREAKSYMDKGLLVPDKIIMSGTNSPLSCLLYTSPSPRDG